uniref:DUF2969 family protein n=1 Tax=Rhabditophanes sp. KR3021 TaxID=114890 RepID=A0AC35TQN8_9BILA
MKEIKKASFKTIVAKVNIASKELAENLEYVLIEYFGDQVTNASHGNGSFEEMYMLSPAKAQKIGHLIIQRMFNFKGEVSTDI